MIPAAPLLCGLGLAVLLVAPTAFGADAAVKPVRKAATASAKAKAAAAAEVPPQPATAEQISASERVYYGEYDCDFKQVVHITASARHPAYVELRYAKSTYLMKPVLSSTGAIRLEDVRGQTLMIQIASKSMLMNVKTGTRLVDTCVSPGQRAAIDAAQAAASAAGPAGNALLAAPHP